jgi:AcrR family transcriptional regulator
VPFPRSEGRAVKRPTRQRLVEAAIKRFRRDGFRNVGVDQVVADVGISKTAFYKHFESKEDLMLAALQFQNGWLQDTFRDMVHRGGQGCPAAALRALFDVVEQIIESDEFYGCIFVHAVIEFPLPHDPAHCAAAENKQAIEAIVRDLAEQAGAADPAALAQELCMIIEGAYVTRQVTGNPRTSAVARRIAERVLAAHLPVVGVKRLRPPSA